VIGVGAAQALLKSGMAFAAKRVVIAGSGPFRSSPAFRSSGIKPRDHFC
jgi:hypothetical protein